MTRELIWIGIPARNLHVEGKTVIYVCQDAAQKYPRGWLQFQLYMYKNGYTYWKDHTNAVCYKSYYKDRGEYHLSNDVTCYSNVFYAN
jgi:hypothetical protein